MNSELFELHLFFRNSSIPPEQCCVTNACWTSFSKICFMPKWKHCPTLLGITMMKPWNFLFHIFDSNGSNFDTHIGTQSHLTFMTLVMVELKFIDDTQHQWSKLCKWIKSFGDWKGFDLERFSSKIFYNLFYLYGMCMAWS